MTTSEQINELAAALSKAQGEMEGAKKDSINPFFSKPDKKSAYADLASVWDACREPLSKHGLSVVQFPRTTYEGTPEIYEWTAKSGEKRAGIRVICTVALVTRLLHTSGQFMEDDTFSVMLPTADPQSIGSAVTYLRRYSLQSAAGIAPEDDDAEAAQGRPKTNGQAKAVPVVPEGYDDWIKTFAKGVDEGIDAFRQSFKAAPLNYREYLSSTDAKRLTGLVDAAKAVTALADAKANKGKKGVAA